MSFDPKCLDLARHFLADVKGVTPEIENDLAQEIQQAIEGFLEALESEEE